MQIIQKRHTGWKTLIWLVWGIPKRNTVQWLRAWLWSGSAHCVLRKLRIHRAVSVVISESEKSSSPFRLTFKVYCWNIAYFTVKFWGHCMCAKEWLGLRKFFWENDIGQFASLCCQFFDPKSGLTFSTMFEIILIPLF